MSITPQAREQFLAIQRAYLARQGVPQRRAYEFPEGDRGWTRAGRCGEWNADAPDPETFFPLDPDSPATYVARSFCVACPVRELCDASGTETGAPGMWGGILRDDHGRAVPLCVRAGCMNYRKRYRNLCGGHADEFDEAARVEAAERAARRAALQATTAPTPAASSAAETADRREVVAV